MLATFTHLTPSARLSLLSSLLPILKTPELLLLSHHISPRLKRDFLRDLPLEISLHVLSFVDSPRTLARASCVSKFWRRLLEDEWTWKEMCARHRFGGGVNPGGPSSSAPGGPLMVSSPGARSDDFVPALHDNQDPSAAFVSNGLGGPSIPTATSSTTMTFGTPQRAPTEGVSGSPSMSSSLGSGSTVQSGLSSTSPSQFSSLLPASTHVSFQAVSKLVSSMTSTTNNPSTSPVASGSILTYPLPPNLPSNAPTQFSSITDADDDNDQPMTDLTATQPSAPAATAPLGFLSTVPFSANTGARKRLVPRGLGLGPFGAPGRRASSPLTQGERSDPGSSGSQDWKQKGKGKGKASGKRRSSEDFDADAYEEEYETGRFSYKKHFKRAYLTG